ncbi:Tn3 family transposase, partial [Hydrogenophaga sp. NFH-34]|uniref:Tn3 family transposase n=1 Tax=Hydrogenophaga sp. NFH-34 TaxID=2744446 RepID=UPI001F18C2F0
MYKDLSLAAERLIPWVAAPLGALGLLAMLASVLAPDRLLFDAGYACVPHGTQLRLFPRHMRMGRFMWWLKDAFRNELRRVLNRGEAVNALKRAIYTGRISPAQAKRVD